MQKRRFAAVACEDAEKWGFADAVYQRYSDLYRENDDEWTKFRATRGEVPTKEDLDKYHGFIFSGSRFSVNDSDEWIRELKEFVQFAAQKNPRPKMVGICFGHQLFASALGGIVDRNPTGEFLLQSEELELSEELKKKPAFSKLCENGSPVRLLEMHGEYIKTLPEGARVLAKSTSCEYEMVEFKENILGLQAHPDILQAEAQELVVDDMVERQAITKEKADEIEKSIWLPLHLNEMNEALRNYLHS